VTASRCIIPILLGIVLSSCATATAPRESAFREPGNYNFRFRAYTVNIGDPSGDRRCYYRVFIDRVEAGRTSTGLESQYVSFEANLETNRHLLQVEKWVLDTRAGRYVKLNNIDQPRPNFVYFEVPSGRVVAVTLVTDSGAGRSMFGVEHERE